MSHLPSELYRVEQIRLLEQQAIERYSVLGQQLMERAGQAAFELMRQRWPSLRRIVVVCGGGSNGGDGYVVARLAHQAGLAVRVVTLAIPEQLKGEAAWAWRRAKEAGVSITSMTADAFRDCELIVDALLGTGLSGQPREPFRSFITFLNRTALPILALDIPSGLDADSGVAHGEAVRAAHTITFVGLKRGLFTGDAPDHCGGVTLARLELPDDLYQDSEAAAVRLGYRELAPLLTPRLRTSHKGRFGHTLVVGGEEGMMGAAQLAAAAAGRVGSGLVSLATRADHAAIVSSVRPEVMSHPVETDEELSLLLARASIVAIGPGLGQGAWGRSMFSRVLESPLPLVVDADALNLLAIEPLHRDTWVLTPHEGEAARLLGCSVQDIRADRYAAAVAIETNYGGVCLLKGAGTLVQEGKDVPMVCSGGNPGMASGGMGDLLSGIIAGLLAQGLKLGDAARLGAALHGAAGDFAAREGGERGLLASDLLPHIRRLANPNTFS